MSGAHRTRSSYCPGLTIVRSLSCPGLNCLALTLPRAYNCPGLATGLTLTEPYNCLGIAVLGTYNYRELTVPRAYNCQRFTVGLYNYRGLTDPGLTTIRDSLYLGLLSAWRLQLSGAHRIRVLQCPGLTVLAMRRRGEARKVQAVGPATAL